MRSLAVTQENLDNQREAVKEEKRLRYDNQPYGQIFDLINEMIYKNFANSHSTIGSMEHLDAATRRGRTGVFPDLLRAEQRRAGDLGRVRRRNR